MSRYVALPAKLIAEPRLYALAASSPEESALALAAIVLVCGYAGRQGDEHPIEEWIACLEPWPEPMRVSAVVALKALDVLVLAPSTGMLKLSGWRGEGGYLFGDPLHTVDLVEPVTP